MRSQIIRSIAVVSSVWCLGLSVLLIPATSPVVEDQSRTASAQSPAVASCDGSVSTTLSANVVRVCEAVIATSRVNGLCTDCLGGLSIVFVEPFYQPTANYRWMNTDAGRVLDMLLRRSETPMRVGVVFYYEESSRIGLDLTLRVEDARGPLRSPMQYLGMTGSRITQVADHSGAVRRTIGMFRKTRQALPAGAAAPCEVVVYMAMVDDFPQPSLQANIAEFRGAIRQLQSEGISVFMGCPVQRPNETSCGVPRQSVGAQRYADALGTGALADKIKGELDARARPQPINQLSLHHGLPEGLLYLPGSGGSPWPTVVVQGSRSRLGWTWTKPAASSPQTVTFGVQPLAEGTWPISASLAITNAKGTSIPVPAQPVTLTVSGLCETPTVPPSPTATTPSIATRTHTPEPTPTLEPTAISTTPPSPRTLYLPMGLKERCDAENKRADVALILDTSSSMTGQKLADARAAATAFVRLMDLAPGRDQVAVVRFDTEAEVVQALSGDRGLIEQAVARLEVRQGTHIDKGLRGALGELQSPRRNLHNLAVAILLTDGVHTGEPGADLIAAGEVRAAGVRLYTIGLGADADGATLREMAGDDARYHFAPDSADLARIYGEIASDILCPAPPVGFWPGR